ncbi:hypothetical protein GCM10010411_69020 [Actinomadura fulvescens]|uniref:Uncharacterized protein n=1 Tax=Actinomadura fulvescens TaxID=46160 RepID=A0ABN3QCX5_9ACTN
MEVSEPPGTAFSAVTAARSRLPAFETAGWDVGDTDIAASGSVPHPATKTGAATATVTAMTNVEILMPQLYPGHTPITLH